MRKGAKARLPKITRVTAAFDPAVLKIFQRMADLTGVSLARTIGDWCGQTADGASVVMKMYSQAKDAPLAAMSSMYARASEMQEFLDNGAPLAPKVPRSRPALPAGARAGGNGRPTPRLVIRGEMKPGEQGAK